MIASVFTKSQEEFIQSVEDWISARAAALGGGRWDDVADAARLLLGALANEAANPERADWAAEFACAILSGLSSEQELVAKEEE
ncbi:hypothetical protein [Thermogutta sp.]|uniref:hypothetical protein n=1 Tax=Thermogutta sp. TaxID=1962930 RepID=UPI00321FCFD1